MENYKNYKEYFVNKETWKQIEKIKSLTELKNMTKEQIQSLDSWDARRYIQYLTEKQIKLVKENNIKELKKVLAKYIEKQKIKLQNEKQKAIEKYNKIAELKDIKEVIINVDWSNGRRSMGAYQTKANGQVWYKNGTYRAYETNYTGGCGYDKPSTSLSNFCNKLLKIIPLKHASKILKDEQKHNKFYALEPLYYEYGVGVSSYQVLFTNLGYKVKYISRGDENFTLIIKK